MQPKNMSAHQRVKYEPGYLKRGRQCTLFGVDFESIAQAARYWQISYSWAKEQIDCGHNKHSLPKRYIHKGKYRGKWRTKHEVADTNPVNAR